MSVAEGNGLHPEIVGDADELGLEYFVGAFLTKAKLAVLRESKHVQLLAVLGDESRMPGSCCDRLNHHIIR